MAGARASADGEVLALGYGDDGVEGQGWYLAGADEGLELEPPVRVGRSMGAERAGQPGATVEDLAADAAPSALDVQAFNRVLACPACGKKCAVSMEQCNGCGASLAGVPESKSGNLFVGFALGAELAPFGELRISMRHESGEVLVFDDPLALSRCHMLAVPMSAYVPDVAALFAAPAAGLRLIEALDAAAWGEVRRVVGPGGDEGWRRSVLSAEGLEMDETELRGCVAAGFNMPPSQYQLHIQYIFPPLLPQHLALLRDGVHFTPGRFLPFAYIREALARLGDTPLRGSIKPSTADTSADALIEAIEVATGLEYIPAHTAFLTAFLEANAKLANYDAAAFRYAKHARTGTVIGLHESLDRGEAPAAKDVDKQDTRVLQTYGRSPHGLKYYSFYRDPPSPLPELR